METTNENILRLLEMLDNPEAYTEQEIEDIINHDDDTREAYNLMVEAKRSSRRRKADAAVDVDGAWQRLEQQLQPRLQNFRRMKIAASFIGVLFVSGIAFAAIQLIRHTQQWSPKTEVVVNDATPINVAPTDTLGNDTLAMQPVVYDNIPLEKMLTEIAARYDVKVTFLSSEARELRFRFVWNPQQGIDQVVSDLNQFSRLKVTLKDDVITVE